MAGTPPKGWSKFGAEHYGVKRSDYGHDEPCYYCGVKGCKECGPPPGVIVESFVDLDADDYYEEE